MQFVQFLLGARVTILENLENVLVSNSLYCDCIYCQKKKWFTEVLIIVTESEGYQRPSLASNQILPLSA
jgi:hypothetical protein